MFEKKNKLKTKLLRNQKKTKKTKTTDKCQKKNERKTKTPRKQRKPEKTKKHKQRNQKIKKQTRLEIGTRRAQIPRKSLIFPSPNKQTNRRTNRQTKNFVHTEVPTPDPRVFSTMLFPTEL